jgi:hypothetical protein
MAGICDFSYASRMSWVGYFVWSYLTGFLEEFSRVIELAESFEGVGDDGEDLADESAAEEQEGRRDDMHA